MRAYITGNLNDVYFHESEFEGKKYPGFQIELFNPDFTSPASRYLTLKVDVETGEKLKLNNKEYVSSIKGKAVTLEGLVSTFQGSLKFRPTAIKV